MTPPNMYAFYITAPNDRPHFVLIQNFVWENGASLDTDTDGDAYPTNSTVWTELTVESRYDGERFDIDPIQANHNPDVLVPDLGEEFDLNAALKRNMWLHNLGTQLFSDD